MINSLKMPLNAIHIWMDIVDTSARQHSISPNGLLRADCFIQICYVWPADNEKIVDAISDGLENYIKRFHADKYKGSWRNEIA